MSDKLQQRYPAIADLARKAKRSIPHFAWEYLDSGTGVEDCLQRNRSAFADITLMPQLMQGVVEPMIGTRLLGHDYAAPFGVAPVGLTGLMWPQAEQILAKACNEAHIPYCLSTVATESVETISPLVGDMGWFQLYPPKSMDVCLDLLKRAQVSGFHTLLVTADVPTASRRERQLRAGVSVPPKINLRTLFEAAIRPSWSWQVLKHGIPEFRGLEPYLGTGMDTMQKRVSFFGRELGGTLDWDYFKTVREHWQGPVLLKGILDVEQAKQAVALGADGIVLSNHGGRQFDGAPAALQVLPAMREAVGDHVIVYDSGVRTGLDIARALALGADFVLLGRAFMYGVAALGEQGGEHVIDLLSADLKNNMIQLGCRELAELRQRLC